jgi:hypothetical protein
MPASARNEVSHSIVINLPEFRLRHFVGQELVASYAISIGRATTPTPVSSPTRRFEIFSRAKHPAWHNPLTGRVMAAGPANPLGTRWLGLMTIESIMLHGNETWESLARQHRTTAATLRRWNNLPATARIVPGMTIVVHRHDGYGIHGTNAPASVGTSVSLGCMRMHNRDVERLFDMLPDGVRIPVTILYEPVVKRSDMITGAPFIEVFYDVYGRMRDKASHVDEVAAQIGTTVPSWLRLSLSEPFAGSFVISHYPRVENNGQIVAVGALRNDNELFLPLPIVERLLGVTYTQSGGEAFLGGLPLTPRDAAIYNQQIFLRGSLIAAITGRGYFYDELQNAVQLSVTRLVVNGSTVSFNSVFVHPELGPLVNADDLARGLGLALSTFSPSQVLLGGHRLASQTLGTETFITLPELRRIAPRATWDLAGGVLTVSSER